jgi:hypothetical protein
MRRRGRETRKLGHAGDPDRELMALMPLTFRERLRQPDIQAPKKAKRKLRLA